MSDKQHKRARSIQNISDNRQNVERKASDNDWQSSHLGQIKEMGKKVLKKLLPNQPMVLLKKLAQKGADNFKKSVLHNQKLLPAITFQSMMVELSQQQPPHPNKFQTVNQELTKSMLFFQQNVVVQEEEGELLRLQTQKCYHHIPSFFFEEKMPEQGLGQLLTRDMREMSNRRDKLMDFYDEVEFNVNQQVEYKIKVFINFVSFLTSIGNLANLSISKIKVARNKNSIIKNMIVQRVFKITLLRCRKEQIERSLSHLNNLKKLKKLQNYLISQVQSIGKLALADTSEMYQEYCQIHEELKEYCCPKMLCKFWDVAYYIERGYQDSFSRTLKNYLIEIIVVDHRQLQEIVKPSKQQFVTVSHVRQESLVDIRLDESYEIEEEEVQLVTKHNIQKEIVSIFQQGLHKCTYPTDQICQYVKQYLGNSFNTMFEIIRQNSYKDKQEVLNFQELTSEMKKTTMDKLSMGKFVRVVQLYSERLKKVVRREISIVEKALKILAQFQDESPEKEEVVSSYLMQIVLVTMQEIDQNLSFLITSRKLPQQEIEFIRQLLQYGQEWRELVLDFKHYSCLWRHLAHFFQEQKDTPIETLICENLLKNVLSSRRRIVEIMISGYYQASVEKLPTKLREDDWMPTRIPMEFYNILGEVLYGSPFTKEIEHYQKKLLSSSLLLDRNTSMLVTNESDPKNISPYKEANNFEFQVTETLVSIEQTYFKMFTSTLQLIKIFHGYLEWVEELGEGESLQTTILSKIMQLLIMYNTHVNELILGKQALKYGKIKSKTITGKHLLLTYSQLHFVQMVIQIISNRFTFFKEATLVIKGKLNKTMNDIKKRFKDFILLKIREQINKLVVDPKKQINCPLVQTKEIVNVLVRSCELIKQNLMEEKYIGEFIGVQWCSQYLQKIKSLYKSVYKSIMSSNGTRKSKDIDWSDNLYWKMRELRYVTQHLWQIRNYIPDFRVIVEELQAERHKLDNPQ